MNLLFSYGPQTDEKYAADGHTFLGGGEDAGGGEVHVFLMKDQTLAESTAKPVMRPATGPRVRKPFPRGELSVPQPFTQTELDKRMDSICGCQGQYDCVCVTVYKKACSELWGEHNERQRVPG